MSHPDCFYADMTPSTADRGETSTWRSRQPPPQAHVNIRTMTIS